LHQTSCEDIVLTFVSKAAPDTPFF
jgi:hypothetical protein